MEFIRQHKGEPFLLYFAHTFPHVPLFASPAFKGKSRRGLYGDVVEELDWSVGQVLDALREAGLAGRTFVFFTSDNGPWLTQLEQGGSAGLLRDGKGSTWEGGMREPAIGWWPGTIQAGVVTHELAASMDLFPTCLALAGAPIPADRPLDGVDMSPILFGRGPGKRETVFYYRGSQLYAVRKGDFKVHMLTQSGYGNDPLQKHDPPLLFNLRHDPSERFNIAAQHPAVLEEIAKEVGKHRAGLDVARSQLDEPRAGNN